MKARARNRILPRGFTSTKTRLDTTAIYEEFFYHADNSMADVVMKELEVYLSATKKTRDAAADLSHLKTNLVTLNEILAVCMLSGANLRLRLSSLFVGEQVMVAMLGRSGCRELIQQFFRDVFETLAPMHELFQNVCDLF